MFNLFDRILYALGQKGALTVNDLAVTLNADKKAVRKVIDRMRHRGLVVDMGYDQNKLKRYGLTDSGQVLYMMLNHAVENAKKGIYTGEEDWRELLKKYWRAKYGYGKSL